MKTPNFIGDHATAVTPSDTETFGPSLIFVGGAGTITVRDVSGSTVQFTAPAGVTLPVLATGVMATGTAATLIVRVF